MPAPLHQPIAAPNRISSSTNKDNYPYSTSGMGSINHIDRGGHGRQGAPANSTSSRNPNSMYNAMSIAWGKETSWLQEEQKIADETATIITSKTKKPAQSSSSPRPVTPGNNRNKNFIERNKQFVQAVPKATVTKKPKEESSPSPSSSPKPKSPIVSTQSRPVTSGTNGQSSARPQAKPDKKKNDGVTSNKVASSPTSPNTRRPASPPASAAHSAHSRSHTRSSSPEKSLREENNKLKRRLFELEDWLREKEAEVLEYEDIVDSYQERIRQVEARNRELQKENEFMRNHIAEEMEKQKSCVNEPTKIISSVMNNIQRIRGDSPISSNNGSASSSPIPTVSPLSSPKASPVLTTSKSKELLKANNSISPPIRPRVVPQTRGNLIPASKVVDVPTGNDHPPRPTAPSPASMNRHEPSSFTGGIKRTEMLDRHAEMSRQASDRKQAAALNVVMEESEDSEVDEFIFERDGDTSDDQADSEFEATTSDDEEISGNVNGMNDTEDDDDDQSDDDESDFSKWSTHASSKLDSIVEEDDEEEDDEFDYEEPQQKKSAPVKISPPKFDKKCEILEQKTRQDASYNPHRDSMSSIKSNSSIDSSLSVLSSQNDSYPSSVTSPSSTDYDSNYLSNYGSFTQSLNVDSSNSNSEICNESSKIMTSNFNNNKNAINLLNGNSKRSISPNLKQSNPQRSTTPSTRASSPTSSTRASTPSSNASTARAQSPMSVTSSRASTPASESSRNANRRARQDSTSSNSSTNKCSTAIPPPPPPPANKDPFATLQHYLRLISENSVMENPLKSYDLDKVIDEGSSAKVYTAHPLSNQNEECAIKVVPLSYSLEFIFNEIYVLKNLKHENIVEFKESFLRWDGKTREVWIAMEKCARGDVTNRAGKINQREVGRIAGDLLSALKHLHSNGIIHRDIKLSNILAGNNNEIKLADFGIASLTPTSTTAMVGTIPYMAPDVVLVGPDRPYDTKADIWSVGVCILELLTGKAAWGRIRDDEIMDKLRRGEMPYGFQRLRKKADIGWEAVDFLEKCFAKTPENRWSAEKLLEHPFVTGNRN